MVPEFGMGVIYPNFIVDVGDKTGGVGVTVGRMVAVGDEVNAGVIVLVGVMVVGDRLGEETIKLDVSVDLHCPAQPASNTTSMKQIHNLFIKNSFSIHTNNLNKIGIGFVHMLDHDYLV
jgi:hypothetical protein